jgi:hypothetical protein
MSEQNVARQWIVAEPGGLMLKGTHFRIICEQQDGKNDEWVIMQGTRCRQRAIPDLLSAQIIAEQYQDDLEKANSRIIRPSSEGWLALAVCIIGLSVSYLSCRYLFGNNDSNLPDGIIGVVLGFYIGWTRRVRSENE